MLRAILRGVNGLQDFLLLKSSNGIKCSLCHERAQDCVYNINELSVMHKRMHLTSNMASKEHVAVLVSYMLHMLKQKLCLTIKYIRFAVVVGIFFDYTVQMSF